MKKITYLLFTFFSMFLFFGTFKAYTAPSNLNGEYFTIKLTDLYDYYEDNGLNDVLYQLYTELDPHDYNVNMDFTIFGTSQAFLIALYNNSSCGSNVVPNFSNWNTYFSLLSQLYKADNNYVYSRVTLSDKCNSHLIVIDSGDFTYSYVSSLIINALQSNLTSGVNQTGSVSSNIGDVLSSNNTTSYYDVVGTYASGNGNYAIDKEWGMYPIYSTNNAGIYYSYFSQSMAPSGSHYFPSLVVHYYGETQVADDFYEHDSNAINHYTGNLGYNLPRLKTYFEYYEDVLPPSVGEPSPLDLLNDSEEYEIFSEWVDIIPSGPLDTLILLPLNMISKFKTLLSEGVCESISITIPIVNYELTLPCVMDYLGTYINGFSIFINIIGVIFGSLILYRYLISLYSWFLKLLSLDTQDNYVSSSYGGV